MRIAIVDDAAADRRLLRERLNALLPRLALSAYVCEYGNGTDFLSDARRQRFDLTFLDIYMTPENGIETAERLRAFDRDCLLVLTTSSTDHALEAFRVRALHYLVKPYSDADLSSLLEEVVCRLPNQERYAEIRTRDGMTRLPYREILYAEHRRHQIHVHTVSGREVVTRQTFREFSATLSDSRFFICSRGVLVNMEHAVDLSGAEFVLADGTKVVISRNLVKDSRAAFGDFLFERKP